MSAQLTNEPAEPQRAEDIRLTHRIIAGGHVITSPDVPELHLSHVDEAVVRADVQPALDAFQRTRARMAAKQARTARPQAS